MEENKIFQDNDELIIGKKTNKLSRKKKFTISTRRIKIKTLQKRVQKTPISHYILFLLPLIFLVYVIILIYHRGIHNKYNNNNKVKSFLNLSNSTIINSLKNLTSLNNEELVFDNIETSYKKAIPFIQKNMKGTLEPINNNTNDNNNNLKKDAEIPLVSAIIPVYNSRNIINRSIRSIQNQDMTNIEIILVNDFSTDDTLSYLETLQQEDPRIKIIKNQKNMGTLYSRSIGALSAKGKYIFPLDNGDMFLDYDVFSTIYNVANKDSFDIVEFKCINVGGLGSLENNRLLDVMFTYHKVNLVLTQPELGYFPLQPRNQTGEIHMEDNYLWDKCIKTEVYQKALNLYGEQRYSRFVILNEDLIIVILLFNVAESFKFIGKYGLLNVPNSGGSRGSQATINLYEMYVLDTLIDFSKEFKENKKIIVNYTIKLLGREQLNETLNNEENKKLFKSMLDRIYDCKLISEEDKEEIKKKSDGFNLN